MHKIKTPQGIDVSYTKAGSGPPLVLVHGGLSDHITNWELVADDLQKHFTVYAIARRGRGETSKTEGHGIPDEAQDVAAVIDSIGEPVFLLGHSYGAATSLETALLTRNVSRLIAYEPPGPGIFPADALAHLEELASRRDWDTFIWDFFKDMLQVPESELAELRPTPYWDGMVADAEASLGDFRSVFKYASDPERFRTIDIPVLFLIGSESPREIYATDRVAAVLADYQIVTLEGQAHEGMTTAPDLFAKAVIDFLTVPEKTTSAA